MSLTKTYSPKKRTVFFQGYEITDLMPDTDFSPKVEGEIVNVMHSADAEFSVASLDLSKAKNASFSVTIMGMSPTLNGIIKASEAALAAGEILAGPLVIDDQNNGITYTFPGAVLTTRPLHEAKTNGSMPTVLTFRGAMTVTISDTTNTSGFSAEYSAAFNAQF